jgi:GT2 family glycosyltransferase
VSAEARTSADRVSIVLLTYNCAHRLRRVLEHLVALDVPIVAVDNASADQTCAVLETYPQIEVLRMDRNIGAAARNVGLEQVTTPYVAFCDDDEWYEPESLALAADALDEHPRLALVNARILVTDDEYLDPISAEMADSPLPERHGIPGAVLLGFMAGACVVRVTAYKQAGGYDSIYFMGGEEETLALKLARDGWQLRYRPDIVVQHRPSIENAPQLRAYGLRNALWTCWLHRRALNAMRATTLLLLERPKDRAWLRGTATAIRGLPWVLRQRSPVSGELDQDLRTLDLHRLDRRRTSHGRDRSL